MIGMSAWDEYKIMVRKPQGKRPLGNPRCKTKWLLGVVCEKNLIEYDQNLHDVVLGYDGVV
jgi:hypothetical protein